jgi:hypothetical protein
MSAITQKKKPLKGKEPIVKTVTTIECPICCESSKKSVCCLKCKNVICQECGKKYILSSSDEPHCMNCRVHWTYKFLSLNFPKTWIYGTNKQTQMTLRDHFKNVSLDREKSKIPESVTLIAEENLKMKIDKAINLVYFFRRSELTQELYKIGEESRSIGCTLDQIDHAKNIVGCDADFIPNEVLEKCKELSTIDKTPLKLQQAVLIVKETRLHDDLGKLRDNMYIDLEKTVKDKDRKIVYVFPCSATKGKEQCRGLVESRKHKCEICEQKYCRKCRVPIFKTPKGTEKTGSSSDLQGTSGDLQGTSLSNQEDHICKEEDVASVLLIKGDSKPCPKCCIPIFKISGCSQMFCTNCKIAFDWHTLKVSTGQVHNPHYFEWLETRGAQVEENNVVNLCNGGEIGNQTIAHIHHMIHDELNNTLYRLRNVIDNKNNEYHRLRSKYIKQEIGENVWKKQIFLLDRKFQKREKLIEIYDTARTVGLDIIRNMLARGGSRLRGVAESPNDLRKRVELEAKCKKELEEAREWINALIREEMSALGYPNSRVFGGNWNIYY